MPVKIRLQRQGKKGSPFYHIVAADVRAKRDGRYIERLGSYNPTTNPASIELDGDAALKWLQNGAIPTDTARAILSYKGVMYRNHLQRGVAKGVLSQEEADKKFEAWLEEKEAKIEKKRESLSQTQAQADAARMAREKEVNEARAKELAASQTESAGESEEATSEEDAPAAAGSEPAVEAEEAPAAEPKAEEKTEAPKAEETAEKEEKKEEAPKAEEKKEEDKKEEEPKAEEKSDEEKKEDK